MRPWGPRDVEHQRAGITKTIQGSCQNFAFELAGAQILFLNSATAGSLTAFTTTNMTFGGTSTAGDANLHQQWLDELLQHRDGRRCQPLLIMSSSTFDGSSIAGNATFTNPAGFINFRDTSTGGNATFTNQDGGIIVFNDFFGTGNAGTGGNATFINNGGAVGGAIGSENAIQDTGDAGNATLIANGGPGEVTGVSFNLPSASTGGTAGWRFSATSNLDISRHDAPRNTRPLLRSSPVGQTGSVMTANARLLLPKTPPGRAAGGSRSKLNETPVTSAQTAVGDQRGVARVAVSLNSVSLPIAPPTAPPLLKW